MKLHCLGTAGYHPNETRHTSCYFVPEAGLVLDAGSGLFRLTDLIQTRHLDILISHAHLDHIVGLTFLLDVLHRRAEVGRPVESLRIFGQRAKLDAIRTHLFSDLIFPVPLSADWIAIDDQPRFQAGGAEIAWRIQPHPGDSLGYRIDWPGHRLIYATDTSGQIGDADVQWCVQAGPEGESEPKRPDLLIHECYFRDSHQEWAKQTGHSWTGRVAEVAGRVRPRRLLLTHLNPLETAADPIDSDRIAAVFDGELLIARDALEVSY